VPTVADSELKDILTEFKITQACMDEKLDAINTSISELKKQTDKQDNRLWVPISGIFLALLGVLNLVQLQTWSFEGKKV
jgi:hypothetical protein